MRETVIWGAVRALSLLPVWEAVRALSILPAWVAVRALSILPVWEAVRALASAQFGGRLYPPKWQEYNFVDFIFIRNYYIHSININIQSQLDLKW